MHEGGDIMQLFGFSTENFYIVSFFSLIWEWGLEWDQSLTKKNKTFLIHLFPWKKNVTLYQKQNIKGWSQCTVNLSLHINTGFTQEPTVFYSNGNKLPLCCPLYETGIRLEEKITYHIKDLKVKLNLV